VILNDGIGMGSGNDEIMKVIAFENFALVYCVDRLVCFDLNTGVIKYNVPAAGSTAPAIIDGIIYQRDQSDLQMRDPKTGKELKRVATGKNEQAFSSSRPNGANGKIFVHSYSDAYCIKAWGK
jgi:outer membrane protein assembly factor BamB